LASLVLTVCREIYPLASPSCHPFTLPPPHRLTTLTLSLPSSNYVLHVSIKLESQKFTFSISCPDKWWNRKHQQSHFSDFLSVCSTNVLVRLVSSTGIVMLAAPALVDRSMTNFWAGVSGKGNIIIF
jgi:hypothetical protein